MPNTASHGGLPSPDFDLLDGALHGRPPDRTPVRVLVARPPCCSLWPKLLPPALELRGAIKQQRPVAFEFRTHELHGQLPSSGVCVRGISYICCCPLSLTCQSILWVPEYTLARVMVMTGVFERHCISCLPGHALLQLVQRNAAESSAF